MKKTDSPVKCLDSIPFNKIHKKDLKVVEIAAPVYNKLDRFRGYIVLSCDSLASVSPS